jgi:hypothetical protein
MVAMCMRKYFGGSRVLVAADETTLAMQLASTMFSAGATVLGPATTLSETRALISRAKPTVVVLGALASEFNQKLFLLELFDFHLPPLFYVKIPSPLPLLAFGGEAGFAERADEDDLLSSLPALSHWPARPLHRSYAR